MLCDRKESKEILGEGPMKRVPKSTDSISSASPDCAARPRLSRTPPIFAGVVAALLIAVVSAGCGQANAGGPRFLPLPTRWDCVTLRTL